MSYFTIHYHSFTGFSGHTQNGIVSGIVGVTPQALTFTTVDGDSVVTLHPNEVVELYTEHRSRGVVIDHIAFDKIGTLEISPIDISPDQLIQRIQCAGFIPQANEVLEWDPTLGPPPEEQEPHEKEDVDEKSRGPYNGESGSVF